MQRRNFLKSIKDMNLLLAHECPMGTPDGVQLDITEGQDILISNCSIDSSWATPQ